MIAANAFHIAQSSYGQYTYDPVVDGNFVPNLPGQLLLDGDFHRVEVMVGHNGEEGLPFTSQITQTDDGFEAFVLQCLPTLTADQIEYVINVLYPSVYNGSTPYPYQNPVGRGALFVGDVVVCNTNYLNRAFNNQTYVYEFNIPPAVHGQDLVYTFYNGTPSISVTNDMLPM